MEIDIGAKVFSSDGKQVGRVDRLIVDPHSYELDEIVMHKGAFLPRDVVIPFDAVERAERDEVQLAITAGQVSELPDFIEHLYTMPSSLHHSKGIIVLPGMLYPQNLDYFLSPVADLKQMEPGSIELTLGTRVYARDGRIGTVDEVITDPFTHQMSSFVVHQTGALAEDWIIPLHFIRYADSQRVILNLRKRQLSQAEETQRRSGSASDENEELGKEDQPMR